MAHPPAPPARPAPPADVPRDRSGTARRVVLGCLFSNVVWPVVIPLGMSEPPDAVAGVVSVGGLLLVAAAMALVMYGAVTDWVAPRTRRIHSAAAVVATLVPWVPSYAWALPGDSPWAWIAGLMAGALAIGLRWAPGVAVTGVFSAAAVAGALLYDDSLWRNVLTVWGAAAAVVVMSRVLVWLLHLLEDAERSREVAAELALADERLRMGRELHDVLGHRLAVIALKAEVAAELCRTDPERARAENEAVRQVAATTLEEVRRALAGETVSDLSDQLRSVRLVLESAGVDLDTAVHDVRLSAEESRLLAAVLREGVTNALRHARPTRASVTLTASPEGRTFEVVTESEDDIGEPDGANGTAGVTGADGTRSRTGLRGLAARCEQVGATLAWGPARDGGFALTVTLAR